MEQEPSYPTVNDALKELAMIEAQLYATGAVDVEPEQHNAIRHKVQIGKLSPGDAIDQGRGILAGRQDYH